MRYLLAECPRCSGDFVEEDQGFRCIQCGRWFVSAEEKAELIANRPPLQRENWNINTIIDWIEEKESRWMAKYGRAVDLIRSGAETWQVAKFLGISRRRAYEVRMHWLESNELAPS